MSLPFDKTLPRIRSWRAPRIHGEALVFIFIGVVGAAALLGPMFVPGDPYAQDASPFLGLGSPGHPLGTDDLGRDVLSRLLLGTRYSLMGSVIAVGVAVLIGFPLGVVAGSFGGWLDSGIMRIVDAILSFPAIILAIGIATVLGPSLRNSMLAIGLVFSPSIARLMRGQILSVKQEPYVMSAITSGASRFWIMRRHFIPNAIHPVIVQTALLFAQALIAEASLSFIGLGIQPPDPSWGQMLSRAYTFMNTAPQALLAPGLAIAATCYSFNRIGDSVEKRLSVHRTPSSRLNNHLTEEYQSAI